VTRHLRITGAAFACVAVLAHAHSARATGFDEYGQDLEAPPSIFDLSGHLRVRAGLHDNFDLDRGPTPSGQVLYPVSIAEPQRQIFPVADLRLRTDLAIYAPDGGAAVKVRIDSLDNLALGGAPDGVPQGSVSQRSDAAIAVKRAYGEVLTPFGLLSAGRMGNEWGLGILANGGDGTDNDSGDAADRIAFVVPTLSHLFAIAYDFSATGPFVPDRTGKRVIGFEPSAAVHTVTFAALHYRGPDARARRNRADKLTPEWGAYVSHRWQENDVPATYLPVAASFAGDTGVVPRGYTASAFDVWLRLEGKYFRVEAEGAFITAAIEQASLVPGVRFREPITSNQFGGAIEAEVGDAANRFRGGFDLIAATGDAAPGFGAFPDANAPVPQLGDLDGAQANPPFDNSVDNFRFHPDYRVDRILFREIVGTVTDAVILRPRMRVDPWVTSVGKLRLQLAGIASFAMNASSTPGLASPLGFEIDPTVSWLSDVGFEAHLEQATLFPLEGLSNPALGLDGTPAQLWRVRLVYGF